MDQELEVELIACARCGRVAPNNSEGCCGWEEVGGGGMCAYCVEYRDASNRIYDLEATLASLRAALRAVLAVTNTDADMTQAAVALGKVTL